MMLYIETDTKVITGGVTYLTLKNGEYNDCDLVEVYRDGDMLKTSICAFQAHYIAYGCHFGDEKPEGDE